MGKAIKSQKRKGNRIIKQLTSIYQKRDNDKIITMKGLVRYHNRAEELERQFSLLNLPKPKK